MYLGCFFTPRRHCNINNFTKLCYLNAPFVLVLSDHVNRIAHCYHCNGGVRYPDIADVATAQDKFHHLEKNKYWDSLGHSHGPFMWFAVFLLIMLLEVHYNVILGGIVTINCLIYKQVVIQFCLISLSMIWMRRLSAASVNLQITPSWIVA